MNDLSDFKEGRKKAREVYEFDKKGVVLNTLVSATSSLTAGGLLSFVENVPEGQMPLIILIIFVAQVVPKLLVELNKAYRVNQARREGFSRGYAESKHIDESSRWAKGFFDMCEHASYF